uniref:C-type lectin domain-containing protein n=1 Tax=Kryptolebias marmoratus TaxID=37003 RepID=A0A3Q2ZJR3_KRYMA
MTDPDFPKVDADNNLSKYCQSSLPAVECQPCRPSWILFQKKCYLFYEDTPWKTWSQSQQFCQNKFADLVVIDNLQEQVSSETNIPTLTI